MSKLQRKAIPFSFMHIVSHTTNELSFSTRPFLVEGVATIVDDPEDNLPAKISPDIDRVFVGQEEVKNRTPPTVWSYQPAKESGIRSHQKTDQK